MNTLQGKNVAIVGGLQGVGLKLTKNLLNKGVRNLYIIDTNDNQGTIQDLRNRSQNTKVFFKCIDELKFNSEIQKTVQDITLKINKIDCFINAMEVCMENDLQRTMDLNTKIYLNAMLAARNVMDRNKGGRGGKIVNVLTNMNLKNLQRGYDNDCNEQQLLINKQMLLSLTEAFGQDEYFQQTGVAVMCVLPVMDKNMVRRNYEWIRKIGLEKLVNDTTTFNQWNNNQWTRNLTDTDLNDWNNDSNRSQWNRNNSIQDDCDQGRNFGDYDRDCYNYYNNEGNLDDLCDNQDNLRLGLGNNNINMMLNILCENMVRGIERGQNGNKIVAGLKGIKNIEKRGYLSRL